MGCISIETVMTYNNIMNNTINRYQISDFVKASKGKQALTFIRLQEKNKT